MAILLDTQGPAIRTGDLYEDFKLNPGDIIEFTVSRRRQAKRNIRSEVNYDGLIKDISVGDTVLVDNGVMQLASVGKKAQSRFVAK